MISKDNDGNWIATDIPRSFNPIYAKSLALYLNSIDPLFAKAQKKSDFEFIFALLNIQGMQDAGWDAFETIIDVFETFNKLKSKIKYDYEQLHLFLVLYGLILEASYPYDLIYNLLNIISGNRYSAFCFPDIKLGKSGKTRPVFASEKICEIRKLATNQGMETNIKPLIDIFDKDLRNAVFHSDYCLYKDELRIPKSTKIYKTSDVMEILNKTLAYYEVVVKLVKIYKASYEKAVTVKVSQGFSKNPQEQAVVMVRKGTGAIGIKDNWTQEEIASGNIPFRLCRLLPYEEKMLHKDPTLVEFPPNKIEKINKILGLFPIFIRRHLLKLSYKII